MESIDLRDVLEAAAEVCETAVQAAGHRLSKNIPAGPFPVRGDEVRLVQVFSNLLGNAVKFTPHGGEIGIRIRKEGNSAVVLVQDNGAGIDPELIPTVFDMFVQGRSQAHLPANGLGIGLTLAKKIVQMHEGAIGVTSLGTGQGSEFRVEIPLAERPVARHGMAPTDPVASAGPQLRILVIDDNSDANETLAVLLRLHGHEVRSAGDGAAGLRVAEEFRPDVVLLDIGLPDISGYQVATQLRAQSWAHELQLVAITGWGQEDDRDLSSRAGIDDHFIKPIDPAVLLDFLRKSRRSSAPGAARMSS